MSRKANKPISIPEGVTVEFTKPMLTVKGPKGELSMEVHDIVDIAITEEGAVVSVPRPDNKSDRAIWGTFGSHVANMITGVTTGFEKKLEINGVGYQFDLSGKKLTIRAGYSHPVVVEIPDGVEAAQEKNVITLTSHDKQKVGQIAAEIRKVRKPEPYKGKGIKYAEEVIIRKQGKQAGAA